MYMLWYIFIIMILIKDAETVGLWDQEISPWGIVKRQYPFQKNFAGRLSLFLNTAMIFLKQKY